MIPWIAEMKMGTGKFSWGWGWGYGDRVGLGKTHANGDLRMMEKLMGTGTTYIIASLSSW